VTEADIEARWRSLLASNHPGLLRDNEPLPAPATDEEIDDLERSLGRTLPPSYRALLRVSGSPFLNWSLPPSAVQLLTKREPFTSVLWVSPEQSIRPLFDIEGGVARQLAGLDGPESCLYGHLLHAVVICSMDANALLLDPLDVDADGEWRVWDWCREGCAGLHRSLLDYFEDRFARVEETSPASYRGDPTLERLTTELDGDAVTATAAATALEAHVRSNDSAQKRWQALWPLLSSESDAARAAVRQLMIAFPDDPVVIGNAIQAGIARDRGPEMESIFHRALVGPNGRMFASSLVWQWPEIVTEVWQETGNPQLLKELLDARRRGTIKPAIEAIMDPGLDPDTRASLTYTLSHTTQYHPDPPQPEMLLEAARRPYNDRVHLAQALLGWGAIDSALGLLGPELEEYSPPSGIGMVAYLLNAIAETAPPAAVPVLIASLKRHPTTQVLRTLAFIDHPDTVPAIADHLDGRLRTDALIGLEQLATPAGLDLLAARAASGDIECARVLARHRDHRAFGPLVSALNGPEHRSAVTGLRDLRHADALPLLQKIVAEDPNDDVATIAAHGIVMMAPASAAISVRALSRRNDTDVQVLAAHWLSLLK
jgi:cell wall assembly regulator SMI1